MICAIVAICLFGSALAQPPTDNCQKWKTLNNFDISRFLGKWYTIGMSEPASRACHVNEYRNSRTGLRILQSGQPAKLENYLDSTWSYSLGTIDASRGSELKIKYPKNESVVQRVLMTDYNSFAVIQECGNPKANNTMYIMARNRHPAWYWFAVNADKITKLEERINKRAFVINQIGCNPIADDV